MGKLIKGTHHVAIKYENYEMFQKAMEFYGEVLGLELVRSWGDGDGSGAMYSTGDSLIEMFASGRTCGETGAVNHFALATDDVDGCIAAVKAFGAEVTMEPRDIVIGSAIPFPARIAFCKGVAGEEIEFFCEK